MQLKYKNHLEWQVILRYLRMHQEQQNTVACYSQVTEDAPKAFHESKTPKFLVSMPPDLNTMCVHGKHTDLYTTALPPPPPPPRLDEGLLWKILVCVQGTVTIANLMYKFKSAATHS